MPAPGDTRRACAQGLAFKNSMDASWVNALGRDLIFEFDPMRGALIPGPFFVGVSSPGTPGGTDGLTVLAPNRLFTQNACEGKFYEVDTMTGVVVNPSLPAPSPRSSPSITTRPGGLL